MTAIVLIFAIFQLKSESGLSAGTRSMRRSTIPMSFGSGSCSKRCRARCSSWSSRTTKLTMEMADQLLGVTMNEPGVSRLVSVDLDEAAAMVAI